MSRGSPSYLTAACSVSCTGPAGSGRPQAELHYTIDLVLTDDPSTYPSLLVERLEWLHQSLTGWVVPRIFIVADGNPPPMMIGGGG
jgi:hypothetical protein